MAPWERSSFIAQIAESKRALLIVEHRDKKRANCQCSPSAYEVSRGYKEREEHPGSSAQRFKERNPFVLIDQT